MCLTSLAAIAPVKYKSEGTGVALLCKTKHILCREINETSFATTTQAPYSKLKYIYFNSSAMKPSVKFIAVK